MKLTAAVEATAAAAERIADLAATKREWVPLAGRTRLATRCSLPLRRSIARPNAILGNHVGCAPTGAAGRCREIVKGNPSLRDVVAVPIKARSPRRVPGESRRPMAAAVGTS